MKKGLILLPLLIAPLLTGCKFDVEITQLTYGTYSDSGVVHLTSGEISTKISSEENFLLALHSKTHTCICWNHFKYVLDDAVNQNHLKIYDYYVEEIDESTELKDAGSFYRREDAPTFYVIKNKKIASSFNYSERNPMFSTLDGFMDIVNKYCKLPKMYFINQEILDEKILNESFVVYYARSLCGDCNYATPKMLLPYFEKHQDKKDLYVFDLQPLKDESAEAYQFFKDKYLLSELNNPELGLDQGVVPTFHVYKNTELVDSAIVFNEGKLTFNETDNCYYATSAYYNEDRLQYFHYLDNVENKDLTKVKIPSEDTYYSYWKKEESSKYYTPLLESFLEKYL